MKLSPKIRFIGIVISAVIFSIVVLIVDVREGPFIRLPVLFSLPVIVISWYGGLIAGEAMAIGLPLIRLVFEANIPKPWIEEDTVINTVILIFTLSLISFLVYYVNSQKKRIKVLQGFLPICSFCKKIRTKDEKWEQMESYITKHSEAEFSHGLCPECAEKHYGKFLKERRNEKAQTP